MKRFGKFFLLGGLSTLIDFVVYTLFLWMDTHYALAIIGGYTMGLWFNYEMGRRHIFTSGTKVDSNRKELIAVTAIAIVGVALNIGIVHLLSYSLWTMDPLLSRIVAIGIVFFWNFFARKAFVYH